jgi:hypothetical protein
MSKMSKAVSQMNEVNKLRPDEIVTNFMGGDSYKVNPLDTLKLVSASSIFGEASYYRKDVKDGHFSWEKDFTDPAMYALFSAHSGKSTTEVFTETIDKALDYDFGGTLDFAVDLRKTYNMRLNPQVIMVRAAIHPKRAEFCNANPGKFAAVEKLVMSRADEPMSQLSYYMFINKGKKNNIPTILKKAIAKKLSSLDAYAVNKYKNHEIGMINAVRISHANSEVLNELMQTGTVKVTEDKETWEQKRSAGMGWREIYESGCMQHMALLRNLRNIFTEVDDRDFCKKVLEDLKSGVLKGKQFPYRYWNAYQMIEKESCSTLHHQALILDALEECMDIAVDNMPKLKGKTMVLSDNSGSAWKGFTSEYGRTTIAEIDNLSSVLTAKCSDEGYIGKFGDKLIITPVKKRDGVLAATKAITAKGSSDVGGGTENGIWIFFENAIKNKEFYDNIVIYSDQQAGTGGLYGLNSSEYRSYSCKGHMINVYRLIQEYRKKVNPKVNVFSCQTAGYDNVLIPEMSYRTAFMYGWTGKEALFADAYIKQWDAIEAQTKAGRHTVNQQ